MKINYTKNEEEKKALEKHSPVVLLEYTKMIVSSVPNSSVKNKFMTKRRWLLLLTHGA